MAKSEANEETTHLKTQMSNSYEKLRTPIYMGYSILALLYTFYLAHQIVSTKSCSLILVTLCIFARSLKNSTSAVSEFQSPLSALLLLLSLLASDGEGIVLPAVV